MLVRENISFERGRNPKTALGLTPVFDTHAFASAKDAAKYIFDNLAIILNTKEIPKDIADETDVHYFNPIYLDKVRKYIERHIQNIEHSNIDYFAIIYGYLHDKFKEMNLIKESISFERIKDPKKALGLGVFSQKVFSDEIQGETAEEKAAKYIFANLPEILGTKTIPGDFLGDDKTYFMNREYSGIIIDYIKKYFLKSVKDIELHDLDIWYILKDLNSMYWEQLPYPKSLK